MSYKIYAEVARLNNIGIRSIRRQDAKAFGYRWLYNYGLNKFNHNIIQGSKGTMLGAMYRGDKILWTEVSNARGYPVE